jgi:hypothetical protein
VNGAGKAIGEGTVSGKELSSPWTRGGWTWELLPLRLKETALGTEGKDPVGGKDPDGGRDPDGVRDLDGSSDPGKSAMPAGKTVAMTDL